MNHIVQHRVEISCGVGINFPSLLRLFFRPCMYHFSVFLAAFNNGLCICECSSSIRKPLRDIQLCFPFLEGKISRGVMEFKVKRALSLSCVDGHTRRLPTRDIWHLVGVLAQGRHLVLLASSKLHGEPCRPGPFRVSEETERIPSGRDSIAFFRCPAVSKMNNEAITHPLERECDVLPSTQSIITSFVGKEIRSDPHGYLE